MSEDRYADRRPRHGGGRQHPLDRLRNALAGGRVKGATREMAAAHGLDGVAVERATRERAERDRFKADMRQKVADLERRERERRRPSAG